MSSPDSDTVSAGFTARKVDAKTQLTSAQAKALYGHLRFGFEGVHSPDGQTHLIKPRTETPQPVVRAEQPALMMTNERFGASRLREWGEQHHPDGYIVAVGCGASLLLPHLFSVENPPKGVALIDLDDRVVAMSQAFVNALRRCQTYEDFYERFFKDPVQAAPGFLSNKQALIFHLMDVNERWDLRSGIQSVRSQSTAETNDRGRPNFLPSMEELFPIWKSLADAGKIQVLHASVTDPRVKDTLLAQWPDYTDHTNVIYHSNVLDHLTADTYPTDISPNSSLHESYWISNLDADLPVQIAALNQWDEGTGKTLFVHTLRMLNYSLRLEVGGLQDIHPLDFAYTQQLQDFIKFLPDPAIIDSQIDYQDATNPEDKMKKMVALFISNSPYSDTLIMLLASKFSAYIGMYNNTRGAEGKKKDGFEWLERRFGSALVQLVQAYDNSSHSRVVHA